MPKSTHPGPKVTILNNKEKPIPVEIIAESIKEVAAGFKKMKNSNLSKRAILILIKDASGVSISNIQKVMDAAASLDVEYLK